MTKEPIPLATISDAELHARFAAVVAESLRVPPSRVTPDTTLPALGAESIDIVEITLDTEHAFTVLMPERTVLELATEVAGDGVFEKDGCLTALGSELLRARIPEVDASAIAAGRPVGELAPVFLRVDVWTRVIRGLLEATPRTCPACGERLVQGSPGRVACPVCSTALDLPSGDDVARAWVRAWLTAREG